MDDEKISYNDVREYEHLFTLAPSFLLERFAKKEKNLVLKFKSKIEPRLNALNDVQKEKLEILLNTDVAQLQNVMMEAYRKTGIRQYEILANPRYSNFIELNMNEIRKIFKH